MSDEIDSRCVTHHHACDCREAAHAADLEALAVEITALREDIERLITPATALLSALDAAMPHIDSAIQMAAIHHCPYGGPNIAGEIEAMRTALADHA